MQPLHEITNLDHVTSLAKSMSRDGWRGRPVLAIRLGNMTQALTGTHRIAAAEQAEIEVSVYEIDADDFDDEDVQDLIESRDDDERLEVLRRMGDDEASALMAAEVEGN